MKNTFSKKEYFFEKEIRKKTTLIDLYKQENVAKEMRIEDLGKQIEKLKQQIQNQLVPQKIQKDQSVQTDLLPIQEEINNFEVSVEDPRPKSPDLKSTLLANLPASEFGNSFEISNLKASQSYDKNLEKSNARLEVISKQEQMLLNLNKQLNEDSNIFADTPLIEIKEAPIQEGPVVIEPSFDLGVSLKKFNKKLTNVIEVNTQMMEVPVLLGPARPAP